MRGFQPLPASSRPARRGKIRDVSRGKIGAHRYGVSQVESTLSPSKAAAAIWSQVAKVDQANLTPEAARAILELDFGPEDCQRVDQLSVKAQKGP